MILISCLIFICGFALGYIVILIRDELRWFKSVRQWEAIEDAKREAQNQYLSLFGDSETPIGDNLYLEMGFFDKKDK